MNWLAHLYLSEAEPRFRVGNLLPDLASASPLVNLSDLYQKGIRCHRKIDVFTDAHPRFKACVARFPSPYRRYGGILTDIYFDHILARDWTKYSAVSLNEFMNEVYRDFETCLPEVPTEVGRRLERIRDEDWIGSYHTIAGIYDVLSRISRRFRRPIDLTGSLPIFQEKESDFSRDFHAFFRELMQHVQR
jgi:acyl carrier protein phosphodiesterase